jgi:hypothetical protein
MKPPNPAGRLTIITGGGAVDVERESTASSPTGPVTPVARAAWCVITVIAPGTVTQRLLLPW